MTASASSSAVAVSSRGRTPLSQRAACGSGHPLCPYQCSRASRAQLLAAAAPAQAGIEQALGKAAAAYKQLGRARKNPGFRRAAAAVTRAERAVQARLAALKALGYTAG